MRAADAYECERMGMTPKEALAFAITASTYCEGVFKGEALLAHWGWRDRGDGGADVWMLSFPDIEDNRICAARKSRREVNILLERFEFLRAEVEVSYRLAMKWLEWLGFRCAYVKIGPNGGAFNVMERRKWGG